MTEAVRHPVVIPLLDHTFFSRENLHLHGYLYLIYISNIYMTSELYLFVHPTMY